MDTCLICGGTFTIEELCKDASDRRGYRRRCKGCQREVMAGRPQGKNSTNLKKRNLVRAAKSRPCSDCNQQFPYYVMDLDHLPEFEKKFSLGKYINHSLIEVIAEIAKCEPVCANCHRYRTHNRGYANM